jgi:hypothetical protein
MKGSIKLSNCADKIKENSNNANPKANEVLELLSTKSLSPKSVVKYHQNFGTNLFHSLNPSLYFCLEQELQIR